MELKRPEDHGHWDGSTFVFDPPITVTAENGQRFPMRSLDTSQMALPPDTTINDVLSALLNPIPENTVYLDEPQ